MIYCSTPTMDDNQPPLDVMFEFWMTQIKCYVSNVNKHLIRQGLIKSTKESLYRYITQNEMDER